ncbi:unnamed protein product [Phytophthora fragariaefolia]|uniref:Unnamed protein product n=1 Tax=Phytophthora fragariaefolia TaxID=1490495 RepID=A0A9W7D4F2_9STRA|nr:unnamed protein product [Phytophthora fragariaefolia]
MLQPSTQSRYVARMLMLHCDVAAIGLAIAHWTEIDPLRWKPVNLVRRRSLLTGVYVSSTTRAKIQRLGFICIIDILLFCHLKRRQRYEPNTIVRGKDARRCKKIRLVHHHLELPRTMKEPNDKSKTGSVDRGTVNTMETRNRSHLLETLHIINHNLPLCIWEYDDSKVLEGHVENDEMYIIITAERIGESIIALYCFTRKEVTRCSEGNE